MVMKLIGNLLSRRKEEKPKAEEEVPDELPSLAEDISPEETKEEKPEQTEEKPEQTEEKHKDNPFKDLESHKLEEKQVDKEEDLTKSLDAEGLEEEENSAQEDSGGRIVKQEPKETEEPELKTEKIEEHKPKKPIEKIDAKDTGFFSGVSSLIENQGVDEGVLKQDLLRKMKDFWYFHPEHEWSRKNKDSLKNEMCNELTQLKRLEQRWITQKKFLEEDKRIILEQEREIQARTEKLRNISKQLKFFETVNPNHYFVLGNGLVAKNISELMDLLEIIDDDTYNYHVKSHKNDFSNWIIHIIKDNDLGEKVKEAKTRQEMIVILENALMGKLYAIDPKDYFIMKNGKIVRNIKEMISALKDSELTQPLNELKNDISFWIRNIFKNDYLADRIQTSDSKEKLIDILDKAYK